MRLMLSRPFPAHSMSSFRGPFMTSSDTQQRFSTSQMHLASTSLTALLCSAWGDKSAQSWANCAA